ncbi:hypothetical protein [Anaerostipes sp. MSJ-23]|uniref:hypothetical protein n=1 Tax=Anaerostipes sp. MSJ-23 TaxID=2841520 RepID=UPI001C11FE42|nr:hypothetical protein [Anaerostipes sp. MSJ-23]MBU5460295.1 hypothetical protein [Anaerostipes sp. MSJ-23]
MSFTGIFKANDGIFAITDSKASKKENDQWVEDFQRNPEKLFPFVNGVAVTYGSNQILTQNPHQIFSKKINLEDFVYSYLSNHPSLDSAFFQELLVKINSNPVNQEPINFLIGRKIRAGQYLLEHHQIGYQYYVQKILPETNFFVTGGCNLYCQVFDQMDSLTHITSVKILQKYVASRLDQMIQFYDDILSYNPVGGNIKSYIFA